MHEIERPGNGRADPAPSSRKQTTLTAQTASGLSWFYLSTMTLMVANLAYTATLSRLLAPAAFGLMAVANLVVLFVQLFARMGLASALVQKPDLSEEEIRAASTAGIAVGLACLVLVWILAPALAALFRAPGLPPVLRGLSVSFVFMGWSMTGLGLLRRELRFRTLSIILAGTYVFGYLVVGVGLALLGAGVWSLVAASVVTTAAQAICAVRHRPASGPARAPLGAVPGGLRLRGTPVGRPPLGLRRQQPRHLHGLPCGEHRGARPVHPGVLPDLPAAHQLPGSGADECAVLDPQPHPAGPGPPAPCLLQRLVAREPDAVPDLRRHRGGGARTGPGRARPAVGPGGRAGPVVRSRRWLSCRLPAHAAAGGRPRGAEPVAGRPDGLHRGAGPAPADGVPLPVPGSLGVRGGRRRRRAAPVRGLPRPRPARPGNALGSAVGGARSGGVRQRRRGPGRRRHQVGADWLRPTPGRPRGRGRRRSARAGAVHPVLPTAGRPLRALDAPRRGRRRSARSVVGAGGWRRSCCGAQDPALALEGGS